MFLLLLTVSLWAVEGDEVENQEPVVSNPLAKQLNYETVLVTYDVEDADGDLMTVSVKVSDDGVKPVLGEKITWEKDGSEMVLIPAGSFEMGDHHDNMGNALPVHIVELDAFYMDVYEVTVGQFRKFVNQSGYEYDGNWNNVARYSLDDGYPMVYVNWNDATAYAKWAGKRLPTEAEWEYADRGGLAGKRYPWGNDENVARDYANYNGVGGKDKWSQTGPVGSLEANGYGLYDMAGNVWEWCQDWYDFGYYNNSPSKNPPGSGTGSRRVLQGGYWYHDVSTVATTIRIRGTTATGFDVCQGQILPLVPPQEGTLQAVKP